MNLDTGGSADSHVIRYRPDIDGLRAVAVLAVIGFHLSKRALPGGYLGVDIFFVLSGYLITAIVWREAGDGEFSIARFYDRRIRRIMPALLLLLFVASAAATAWLLPADLIGYGKSLLATLAFVANIYFWRDTDYFSRAAEEKPLLHLWSLGVEEQFYIFFPLLLALLSRRWRRGALPAIAALTLASLGLNMLALRVGADSPAFFLLPTRAWELGLGALLALLPATSAPRPALATVLAPIGALLLGFALVHPTPLLATLPDALPAVLGASLLILAGQRQTPLPNRALGLRPLVFIGLISYSLYLWHWPIIVFARYVLVRDLQATEVALALAAMLACAVLSWRYVERPFRSREMPAPRVRGFAASGVALLATASLGLIAAEGLPRRLSAEAAAINRAVGTNYRCPVADYFAVGGTRACPMNLPSKRAEDADAVLLGNSHAQMYAPVWTRILAERGSAGLLLPANGCLPTVQANISRDCIEVARRNLAAVAGLARMKTVILGLTWQHEADAFVDADGRTLDNLDNRALVTALDDLIVQLQGAGKQVLLIGPIAYPGWDMASAVSRQIAFGQPAIGARWLSAADFKRRFGSAIEHFEARPDIGFARPDRVQCGAERCEYFLDGHSLFADSSHVAVAELDRFRAEFAASWPPRPQ